jgi:hypothetical protein
MLGLYLPVLEFDYKRNRSSELIMAQVVQFVEYIADSRAIKIKGLEPKIYREEVVDFTLFYLYENRGSDIFESIAMASFFSPVFAFLAGRTERDEYEYRMKGSFLHLCKKSRRIPKGVARRYQRSLYHSAQLLEDLDQVGCMNASCPEKKCLVELKGVPSSKLSDGDKLSIQEWGKNLKLCSALVMLKNLLGTLVLTTVCLAAGRLLTALGNAKKQIGTGTAWRAPLSSRPGFDITKPNRLT